MMLDQRSRYACIIDIKAMPPSISPSSLLDDIPFCLLNFEWLQHHHLQKSPKTTTLSASHVSNIQYRPLPSCSIYYRSLVSLTSKLRIYSIEITSFPIRL